MVYKHMAHLDVYCIMSRLWQANESDDKTFLLDVIIVNIQNEYDLLHIDTDLQDKLEEKRFVEYFIIFFVYFVLQTVLCSIFMVYFKTRNISY